MYAERATTVTKVSLCYHIVTLGFYGLSFHSCLLPTIFMSMRVADIGRDGK
jgi:hypothetical protein